MAVYTNDLRLKEIATGDESGTWGTSTNTNLSLVAEAFSFGTEAITTNADTHTTTIADGATDPGRSIFLKYTGTLDSACTITIGPNTVSKLWLIENATSGSQNIIIKQGSGATITVPNGQTKAIYSDGAGSGGAMVDAFQDLSIPDLFIDDDLTFTSDSAVITFGADGDTTLTHTDGTGLTLNGTNKLTFGDAASFVQQSSDGVLRIDGEATIDLNASTAVTVSNDLKLDSDSAVLGFGADNDTTLTHTDGSGLTLNSTNKLMFNDASQFIQGSSATVLSLGATDEIDLTATAIDINGNADVSGTLNVAGNFTSLGIDDNADATAITIDSSENVLVGKSNTTFSDNGIELRGSNGGARFIRSNAEPILMNRTGSGGVILGMYQDGTVKGEIGVESTGITFNESSADLDFRVESDGNTHALFVDAGNDRVGVLTSAPDSTLHVAYTSSNANPLLEANAGLNLEGSSSVRMLFGTDQSSPFAGYIQASNTGSGFPIALNPSGGNIGVGTTNPGRLLTLFNDDQPVFQITNNTSGTASTRGLIQYVATGTSDAIFDNQGAGSGGPLLFQQAGTERFRLNTGEAVFNESSNDYDFRVESDGNTHMLFVDAGNNRVGISNNSPSYPFHITTTESNAAFVESSHDSGTFLWVSNSDATTGRTANLGFAPANNVAGAIIIAEAIEDFSTSANRTADLAFQVRHNGTLSERWRIHSDGPLVSGGQTPVGLAGDPADANFVEIGPGYMNLARDDTAAAAQILFAKNGTSVSSIQTSTNGLILQVTDGQGSVVVNDAGNANTDFRVESNSRTHALFVDAGSEFVCFDGSSASSDDDKVFITTESQGGRVTACGGNFTNGALFLGTRKDTTGATVIVRPDGDLENVNNAYGATSDSRLKQDIVDASSQWDDIKALKVRKYRFKSDPEAPLQIGVVAQELEETSPGLVKTTEDDSINYGDVDLEGGVKTVKYSVLYMKAIKALQEAITRIETLEAEVTALKGE